ncbi:MAG: hypothetical protein B1H08_03245 [Candidatus Omnitrophica bacterium 4484_171]|nr:MAG: hypothetical protein B1H08_03245 [Candidatus Omnitrophica bacterium 4484_171]
MKRVSRLVIWVCSRFTREQIEFIVKELSSILKSRNPSVKPKDNFKEKYPNYRKFIVDSTPPLAERPALDYCRRPDTDRQDFHLLEN